MEELYSREASEDAATVRKFLETSDFDVAGLTENGVICGYIEQRSLSIGACGSFKKQFEPSELLDESRPLSQVLPLMKEHKRLFTIRQGRVTGIVTRGDLQKAPLRLWIFGLSSILEMYMVKTIRASYPDDSWENLLKKQRIDKIEKLFTDKKKRNEATDRFDCLDLCDENLLATNIPAVVKLAEKRYGRSGQRILWEHLDSVRKLRNKVAHSQDLVTGSTWTEIIGTAIILEHLTDFFESLEPVQ